MRAVYSCSLKYRRNLVLFHVSYSPKPDPNPYLLLLQLLSTCRNRVSVSCHSVPFRGIDTSLSLDSQTAVFSERVAAFFQSP